MKGRAKGPGAQGPAPPQAAPGLTPVSRPGMGAAPRRPAEPFARERLAGNSGPASLSGAGRPLPADARAFFESRFGHDFSRVRVYADATAAASARRLDARAYTSGSAVVFGKGQYAPGTPAGRRLLAHELTHVVQQARGASGSEARLEGQAGGAEAGRYPAIAPGGPPWRGLQLSPDRATRLVIVMGEGGGAQFTIDTDTGESLSGTGSAGGLAPGSYQIFYDAARRSMTIRTGAGAPIPETSRFYIQFSRRARRLLQLLRAATAPIPMEVRSGAVPEGAAGADQPAPAPGPGELRRAIDQLPERIHRFLFRASALSRVEPGDYPAVLRIGRKLMELSDSELEAYRARTVETTTDLAVFEASLDRYIAEIRRRRDAVAERERTKIRLYGLDEVYRQYREYRSMLSTSATLSAVGRQSPEAAGTSLGMQPTLARMLEELTANLRRHGFNSLSEFERSIREFRLAFRDETVLIAREMLDRYEHMLMEAEERYGRPGEAAALYRQLQPARERFQEASAIRRQYERDMAMAGMPRTARASASANLERLHPSYGAAMARGRSAVSALSGAHPVLGGQDVPQEALALAGQERIQEVMGRHIRARRADVRQTRQNLAGTPDMVFELDLLVQRAFLEQNIRPGSIYHMIIQDHIRDTQIERVIINLAVAVFALAAGLMSGGAGTVAVLGTATALGIGAYQAVEEFRRWERTSAAHGAQLISEDPSFAWVVVAIVGAGIDLAAAGAAIRALRPAVRAFNETGDVVALERRLAGLTQVEERVRASILRAAEAEAQARAAWRSVFRPPAALRMVIVPGAEEFGRLVYAVYLSARRGIREFELFVRTREAVGLIGDVARLSPEQLTSFKAAYRQAVADWGRITRHGRSLGMTDDQVHRFMRMWNNRRGMTGDEVIEEMDAWHAAARTPAGRGQEILEEFAEAQGRYGRAQREMPSGPGRGAADLDEPGRMRELDPGYDPNWAPAGRHRFPARSRGEWIEGGPGDGRWRPHDPGAFGLERGQSIPFREGVPDFRAYVRETPAGRPGTFRVRGLTGDPQGDYEAAVRALAARERWTVGECQQWLRENNLRLHHYSGDEMQIVPERLHGALAHQGSASELR